MIFVPATKLRSIIPGSVSNPLPLFSMSSLRKLTLTLGTALGLLVAGPALAANVTIEQVGAPNALGSWVLRGPDGRTWHGNASEQTVSVVASGSYTLNVQPPAGAPDIVISLETADGTQITQTQDLSLTATLASDRNYRFVVELRYESLLSVESIPTGAPFSIEDVRGRVIASGETPDQVTVPSGTYTAKYGFLRGCSIPRPQTRSTGRGEMVDFLGRYECGRATASSVASRSSSSASSRSSVSSRRRASSSTSAITGQLSLWVRPQTREAMPGGNVIYTLGVRNDGSVTQRDLMVRFRINRAHMSFQRVPTNGAIVGSGSMLSWRIPELEAGRTWSVQFPVHVNDDVRAGTRLEVTGTAQGPNIANVEAGDTELRATAAVGVPVLPPTGAALDLWFVLASTAAALLLTFENRRRQRVA